MSQSFKRIGHMLGRKREQPMDISDGLRTQGHQMANAAVESGQISNEQAMQVRDIISKPKPPTPDEMLDVMDVARQKTVATMGINEETFDRAKHLVRTEEGSETRAYPDAKGIMTVGVGFNLEREDAREIMEGLGYNYDKVLKQEEHIHPRDVDKLLDHTLQQTYNELTQKLKNNDIDISKLPSHQVEAMMSLYFNAPSLIGPNLMRNIKEGNLDGANDEIEFRSNGGTKPDDMTEREWQALRAALGQRRRREAMHFRGAAVRAETFNEKPKMKPVPGS